MALVGQELLTLSEHMSSHPVLVVFVLLTLLSHFEFRVLMSPTIYDDRLLCY